MPVGKDRRYGLWAAFSTIVSSSSQFLLLYCLDFLVYLRDGLVARKVHPVVPPKAEYELTPLGLSLGAAFCGVWVWTAENLKDVEKARSTFDEKALRGD
ncbi:winged helix-turn-helix transcriptional regulator [Paraburkholderia nemoris]|uniref:winged helix-turn-helix transcriptional regulator n=1 Tax=Paraburkholderia nemoris TaxID=2793076 RepID=UPI0038BD3169